MWFDDPTTCNLQLFRPSYIPCMSCMLATHLVILLFILNCRVRHDVKCRLFQISKMLALPIALQKKKNPQWKVPVRVFVPM